MKLSELENKLVIHFESGLHMKYVDGKVYRISWILNENKKGYTEFWIQVIDEEISKEQLADDKWREDLKPTHSLGV